MEAYEGEFLTLLGSSGCGKATILRMISGLEHVTEGKVYIDDVDVTEVDPTKREVNTIFQNFALFPHMTVFENVSFGLRMKKIDKKAIDLLQKLYPDRKIEPIYAREILLGGGNVHCITQQVPKK